MWAQIDFQGAVGSVTGSKSLLSFDGKKYLIDCGLFQGHKLDRAKNWEKPDFDFEKLESLILTHAHLDHSGYVPRLVKLGFRNPIYCSEGTAELCKILWMDAAKLQEEDADYANRSGYSNHKPAFPLYTIDDAEAAVKLLKPCSRNGWIRLGTNISVKFLRSGHIIGSSFLQFSLTQNGQTKLVTFSGDVGNGRLRTLKEPVDLDETDILVIEGTYGNRPQSRKDPKDELGEVLKRVIKRKGVVVIPAFAVGRSQEILYLIRILENEGVIPAVPVLLDSPMSLSATDVFLKHKEDSSIFGIAGDEDFSFFPRFYERVESTDESMMACMREGPMIVISASGMLSGGRVLHHLKKRLPDERNCVLFVGYQAEGSKGRFLQEKGNLEGNMRIHHEVVQVNAEVATISSLSAHGDAQDLMEWISRFRRKPQKIYVNHGSEESTRYFANLITQSLGIPAIAVVDEGKCIL